MSNCVVTGGAGFIGSNMVDLLLERGHKVLVIDNFSTGQKKNVDHHESNPNFFLIAFDLTDFNNNFLNLYFHIEKFFNNQIDYISHFAALPRIQPSFEDPISHEEANVHATINILELARKYKVKKFVYSGSSSCYGDAEELPTTENCKINPMNPYAIQKYASELYCQVYDEFHDVPTVRFRYFNAYGPRSYSDNNPQSAYSSVIGIFAHRKVNNLPIYITGDGTQRRDFVHVKDIAEANYLAAISDVRNDVFNIGCGKSYSINEIVNIMGQKQAEYIPARKGEAVETLADISKAKQVLKWKPKIKLEEGIKETIEYYRGEQNE
jgi:UDP-glucose 4-epimerase